MPDSTNKPSSPLGIAIVGAGGIALSHMAAIGASPAARLVSICDAAVDRARQAAVVQECSWTGDIAEVLSDPAVDAVILCTPNSTHEALGRRVLEAGKHLLMEKPLAMTVKGAESLAEIADGLGLALAVGHSHRFSDQSLAIRSVIDSGRIGTPRFIRITMNGGWIWPGWQAWVLDPAVSGGHSLHNGVHLMDLAAWWMTDSVTSVFSRGQKVTSAALGIYDYLVTELSFADGASAICEVSRGEMPRSASLLEILVVGTDGVISRSWDADGVLSWHDQNFQTWPPQGSAEATFIRELESFVAATRDPSAVEPPVADAIVAIALAIASEESLASGSTVPIGGTR